MNKKYCDLCENEMDEEDNFFYFTLKKGIFPFHRGDIVSEVCIDCRNKIKKFYKSLRQ